MSFISTGEGVKVFDFDWHENGRKKENEKKKKVILVATSLMRDYGHHSIQSKAVELAYKKTKQ